MMVSITGTPGTGKTAVSSVLRAKGYNVLAQNDTIEKYILEKDEERDAIVIDEDLWADEFPAVDGIIEGHITHILPSERVIVLRCRPDVLEDRLRKRGYSAAKVKENVLAEALDTILIETVECHGDEEILELDTTSAAVEDTAAMIDEFIKGLRPAHFGDTDWSEFLGYDL
jgi:adenylate kinase